MIHAIILVCVLNQPCTPETARDVVHVPGDFASPIACAITAQQFFGSLSLAEDMDADELIQVVCK